jgi:hypothetical protein
VQKLVYECFALRFGHGIPLQSAGCGELAHVAFAFDGCQPPPLIAFSSEISEDTPLALRRQLLNQLHYLLIS